MSYMVDAFDSSLHGHQLTLGCRPCLLLDDSREFLIAASLVCTIQRELKPAVAYYVVEVF